MFLFSCGKHAYNNKFYCGILIKYNLLNVYINWIENHFVLWLCFKKWKKKIYCISYFGFLIWFIKFVLLKDPLYLSIYSCFEIKNFNEIFYLEYLILFIEIYGVWRPSRKSGLTPKTSNARVVRYACNHSIASLFFWVNPLFLGGLHILSNIFMPAYIYGK